MKAIRANTVKPIATLCIDTSVAFPRKRESSTAAARPQPLTSGASAAPLVNLEGAYVTGENSGWPLERQLYSGRRFFRLN